jgi:hypothetical protein
MHVVTIARSSQTPAWLRSETFIGPYPNNPLNETCIVLIDSQRKKQDHQTCYMESVDKLREIIEEIFFSNTN